MEKILFYVHSDVDENNVLSVFENRQDAINYAKEQGNCWVDRAIFDANDELVFAETIWTYVDEE